MELKLSERETLNESQPCFVKLHASENGVEKNQLFSEPSYLVQK